MKNVSRLVPALALGIVVLGGCVDQKKYDNLSGMQQTNAARLEEANQENKTLQASVERKQVRIDELEAEVRQLRAIRDALGGEIEGVKGRQQAIQDALGNIRFSALDPETDRALTALAAQYPDLIKYVPEKGMLQFLSDLTFDSGSDVVKPTARTGLERVAQILNGPAAGAYDLRIVGHTDNQPITNPATQRRYGTNRHLSAYRAIAVEEALRGGGVSPGRMEIAGWGEFRPAVQNNARGGTGQNRRVEIYIVPNTGSSAEPGAAAPESQQLPSRPAEMPYK